MKVLEIDLQSLPPGASALETAVPAADLDLAHEQFEFTDPIRVELDIAKGEKEIVFDCTVLAPAQVACSRCLNEFEDTVEVPFRLICHRVDADSPMLGGEEEEGIRFIPYSATSVPLAGEVRTMLILALPINPVCREDCRGLCPQCGSDLNAGPCGCAGSVADPRWRALEQLRGKENG
jgi:uncharacterized protein